MKIEKVEKDWYNKLLNRRDLELILTYESSTPKREDVRKFISEQFDTPIERVIVEEIKSVFGSRKARIHAHIYDDVEYAMRFERKHVLRKHALISVESEKIGKTS
jgi:ribosomal protein S24E